MHICVSQHSGPLIGSIIYCVIDLVHYCASPHFWCAIVHQITVKHYAFHSQHNIILRTWVTEHFNSKEKSKVRQISTVYKKLYSQIAKTLMISNSIRKISNYLFDRGNPSHIFLYFQSLLVRIILVGRGHCKKHQGFPTVSESKFRGKQNGQVSLGNLRETDIFLENHGGCAQEKTWWNFIIFCSVLESELWKGSKKNLVLKFSPRPRRWTWRSLWNPKKLARNSEFSKSDNLKKLTVLVKFQQILSFLWKKYE